MFRSIRAEDDGSVLCRPGLFVRMYFSLGPMLFGLGAVVVAGSGFGALAGFLLALVLTAALVVRAARLQVRFHVDGVRFRNIWRSGLVPWSQVRRIYPDFVGRGSPAIYRLELTEGTRTRFALRAMVLQATGRMERRWLCELPAAATPQLRTAFRS